MTTTDTPAVTMDNRRVVIEGERNLLELARKAGIEIPTFCYHSELSIYGACRLCLVDIEGMGVVASCSTAPKNGMVVRTNTEEIRGMRKIAVELLLANHDMSCPSCPKSAACKLLALSRKLGVEEIRYKRVHEPHPIDRSSVSIVRDPNKCVLCGDCVRACHEIQGVGAIDFAYRGASSAVLPAFGKDLAQVECVNCGQCAAVCPTGALAPRFEVDEVWKAIDNPAKTVVVQMAPAVRAALGEMFHLPAGTLSTGKAVAALKAIGFDKVYDTSFTADMTVLEEATEFLGRFTTGQHLPQFTSCCPAWVKFIEQYYPNLLPNVSSCKSPQQMFGALARKTLPAKLGVAPENLVVVSLMPCTAKKFEAKLDKFTQDGVPEVDHVITTQELGRMIEQAGIDFNRLEAESFDMPFGFKTGAGVLFGATGGVTEAVLRYAAAALTGGADTRVNFQEVRGEDGLREAEVSVGGTVLRLAMVHGLANARKVAERIEKGDAPWHLIEVMACPGGCIAGAGQPQADDPGVRRARTRALYEDDKNQAYHSAQENVELTRCYDTTLGAIGGHTAHELLHTAYQNRRRIEEDSYRLIDAPETDRIQVSVCVGTACFIHGSQALLKGLAEHIESEGLRSRVRLHATFCMEHCGKGPNVKIGDTIIHRCTLAAAKEALARQLDADVATV